MWREFLFAPGRRRSRFGSFDIWATSRRKTTVVICFLAVLAILGPALFSRSANATRSHQATLLAKQRPGPYVNLRAGRSVTVNYAGATNAVAKLTSSQTLPLSLASADLDEDGVSDLISGYADGQNGIVSIQRGNADALWPYGEAVRNGAPQPFLPNANVFALPSTPDFLAAGDFDADGHWDVVAARRGEAALYFLRGDGGGNLVAPEQIKLDAAVTALDTSDVNRRDGLTDIVVGTANGTNAHVLVFEGPNGALRNKPEEFELNQPASSFAFASFTGGVSSDIAVAGGDELTIIKARDRRLSSDPETRAAVPAAEVTHQSLGYQIESLALGEFKDAGGYLAALADDGTIHFLALPSVMMPNEAKSLAAMAPNQQGSLQAAAAVGDQSSAAKAPLVKVAAGNRLSEMGELTLPDSIRASGNASLIAAHVSAGSRSDLIVMDRSAHQLHIVTDGAGNSAAFAGKTGGFATSSTGARKVGLAASLNVQAGEPLAVLPMRLSPSPLNHLVVLTTGESSPAVFEPAAVTTFTVTNTNDTGSGSLRQAILDANDAEGETSIVFNLPNTDPGRDPVTGAFIFKPELDPEGNMYSNLLPDVWATTITIDGYTQPGAHPNTLADGDNAVILIRIDGFHHGEGSVGLRTVFNDAVTVRGLAITNFPQGKINSDGTFTGGWGIDFDSIYGFVEGNFLGTDETGKVVQASKVGIMLSNAGLIPKTNETLGGTTPQARNLISGNTWGNVGVFPYGCRQSPRETLSERTLPARKR